MEDMSDYLAPCDEHVTLTRNGTELSRFSEGLLVSFLRYGASHAVVRHEMSPFAIEKLYSGLRNVCAKNDYRGLAKVHRQNGKLILVRMRPAGRGEEA